MTTKLIELQVEIPDSVQPSPTNERICDSICLALDQSSEYKSIGCLPITEIKVTKTMPSFNKSQTEEYNISL